MKTLVIVDSSHPVPYRRVSKAILEPLDHFGILYEILDLSWVRITERDLNNVHLLVIGQEGIGKSINTEEFNVLLKKVFQGMGFVIFDGYLTWYPEKFLDSLKIGNFHEEKTECLKVVPDNWITQGITQSSIELKQPVSSHPLQSSTWSPFLKNENDLPIGVTTSLGNGKIVLFSTSAGLWQDEYLGHTEGLDGVFWRSLIWAAKKPFIMKAMPPFVTARIDDVSGAGSTVSLHKETVKKLNWLETFNTYGFIPNLGVFVNDIDNQDSEVIKQKFFEEKADFSPHAFTDPENVNEFPIYMKHSGEEFTQEILENNFEKVDRKFSEWNIKPSRTVNAHFGEIGLNALPFLKERGGKYLMNPKRVGKAWNDPKSSDWPIKPYGKPYFSMGSIPEDKDFFNIVSLPGASFSSEKPEFDFLYGCTTFWKENSHIDVDKAIKRGVFQIKRGLENMFFGCLTTHEQRISYISLENWDKIIRGISAGIKEIPHIFKSYDYIGIYAENRSAFEITKAECKNNISVWLKGKNKVSQLMYLFLEENGTIRQSFLEIPPFEKFVVLNFKL